MNQPEANYTEVAKILARVFTIEYIVGATEDPNLEACLDMLRETGAAAVVKDIFVSETYDEACAILRERGLISYP